MRNLYQRVCVPSCDKCESKSQSFFCSLSNEDLQKLSLNKINIFFKKGQEIFHEGGRPNGLFCIYSGKVKIQKIGEDGKDQIVRLAKKSDIIGYRALLSNEPYGASATAIEDTVVCHLSKSAYFDILMNNPELSMKTIQQLSADLKTAERLIMSMAQKPVRERMAATLLALKEFYGTEKDCKTINAILTREDIGNLAGTTTESAIRTLSDFNKEKMIKLTGKKITIIDMTQLIKIARIVD
ncbi:Crp/Fnr family transcriptional regulator [Solitalea lacus]|uniref:Crp/Fnr family transcriptional regulator n=1 Tax=Solitalea lacus TaxID=2911172 RepID=UPI001EDADD5D|nr:Crp/Fnr family transcriptional regulator [Solitalea lacus]UKJ08508.1 Crp/Fnr family transcriptional regulator [Solitalea lacus]